MKELPVWVRILREEALSKEEMLTELELIDDLLSLVKAKSLLNRKKNLRTQLEARIGMNLGHKPTNLNIK